MTTITALKLTARTAAVIGSLGFLAAPLCGSNAAIVFIASLPFVAVACLLFCNPDI